MPSAKILAKKQKELDALAEKIKKSSAGVLVNYQGITVAQDTALRTALRKAGVDYKVYKNTMTERACTKAGYSEINPLLRGMTALALSADPIAPAKVMKEYADKIEKFEIKAGFIDGKVIDRDGVIALADIPPKEVLVAKILGSIQSSLYGLAYVLQAKIDKENGGEAADEPAAQ